MVHYRYENRPDARTKVRDGSGYVVMYHLFEESELMGKAKACTRLVLDPGCSIGSHPHGPDAEIYYVAKGTIVCNDNGEEKLLHEGDVVFTANGHTHGIRNDSRETAELFTIILP